jgi:hypothetical protein
MRGLIAGLVLLSTLAASAAGGPGKGEVFCGEAFESVDSLEGIIKAKPGIKVLVSDATIASYSDPATGFIWNFARSANDAFPYVACRRPIKVGGAYWVKTDISCGAAKATCDRLVERYNELDRKMRETIEREHKR